MAQSTLQPPPSANSSASPTPGPPSAPFASPPQPVPPSNTTLNATTLPSSCLQFLPSSPLSIYTRCLHEFNPAGLNITGPTSEDCLTLSIWTPTAARELLPVVVFVYGGSFVSTWTNPP
ncbi:Carboxylesterase family-domain-containing protein [Lasiosphaeria hispida]|uniref:Carboxylesterase family-domain-containing protein n=1 Tax=Lasiosphaeria hispida TaxID=260671 RepID=A0AAJ0HGX8_9PEZI|nr:Carboxylesterase family-domain-containing protein [Lasiosphaeria hispida]